MGRAFGGDDRVRGRIKSVRERAIEIGITVATNTMLFTSLDLGQWIADKLSLWTFPANIVAAVIATAFGVALASAGHLLGGSAANAATASANTANNAD
jgi:hypothetical protein